MDLCQILTNYKSIAVVGISNKPGRDSGWIARFLKDKGYYIFGVNPSLPVFEDIPVYKSLLDIPEKIDIVNIFRRPDLVTDIVKEAIEIKAKVVWMQLGVINYEAKELAERYGITVVMDRCIYVAYNHCF